MSNILDIFEKIIVDGQEINLQSLISTNGTYNVGQQKDVTVEYVLKNNATIPAKLFENLKQAKSAYISSYIKNINEYSFAGSGICYINDLSYVSYIGDHAFSYTYLTNVSGITSEQNISYNAFSYIPTLSEDCKENILTYQPNSDFGYISTSYSYTYTYTEGTVETEYETDDQGNVQLINTDNNTSYSYTEGTVETEYETDDQGNVQLINTDNNTSYSYTDASYTGYDTNALDYNIGAQYKMPLIYTTRSGEIYTQNIGDVTFEIVDIDQEAEHSDPFKVKFKINSVDINSPLTDRTIDYNNEIVNRCFWAQDSCLTGDIDIFRTLPDWVDGVSGIDSFLTMKTDDASTYFPELENSFGVTDYAIRKTSNNMEQFMIATTQI